MLRKLIFFFSKRNKKVRALALLSGGLDSMLAAKILMEQGIEVRGLSFASHFFGTTKARRAAEQLGVKLIEIDFSEEHLAMVKKPEHGYGANMNPCIDCHALMLKKAGEFLTPILPELSAPLIKARFVGARARRGVGGIKEAETTPLTPLVRGVSAEEKFDFIATGEVLGQRPMSQNMDALKLVAKISGLNDLLVRPLSAQLLDLTKPENEGKIKRDKLLNIRGRSRKIQQELAKKYGLTKYPSPAGGCLLTDPSFSQRLKQLFEEWPECRGTDVELLKHGRIFWLRLKDKNFSKKVLLVIGRNKEDNDNLLKLAEKDDIIIELAEIMGPTTLVRIKNYELRIKKEEIEIGVPEELKMDKFDLWGEKSEAEIVETAALLTGFYSTRARGRKVKIEVRKII